MGEIWEKQGSPGLGLIFLLKLLNPGSVRLTRLCVASSVLLDVAGMCVWGGKRDIVAGGFLPKLPECGGYPFTLCPARFIRHCLWNWTKY